MSLIEDTALLERVADDLDHRLGTLTHLEWEPQCQGEYHPRGLQGHQPEQPAKYWLIAPCHGARITICQGRVDYLHTIGLLRCTQCNVSQLIERWTIWPINPKETS